VVSEDRGLPIADIEMRHDLENSDSGSVSLIYSLDQDPDSLTSAVGR
jgi:hypothetical protein